MCEGNLIDPFVLRELGEDSALCEGDIRKLGAQPLS
jgi:hypothetical protein